MIDLSVSGALEKDMVVFSLNGESKAVDPFTKQIHFSLEEKKTYRLYFEQKPAQYIPPLCRNPVEYGTPAHPRHLQCTDLSHDSGLGRRHLRLSGFRMP